MANTDGLARMEHLLDVLGHPENRLKIIHIAGTNGKGSTAYMIASILEQEGFRVGLFTSPHLEELRERIQIWDRCNPDENGSTHFLIPEDEYEAAEQEVEDAGKIVENLLVTGTESDEVPKTFGALHYFEKLTAIAYLYFSKESPDYVVIECGLGGRLDSTNTIDRPLVSVITQIGLEHTDILGNTIIKIAREKAGIIKPGSPVVSQTDDTLIRNVLFNAAREAGCDFYDASLAVDKLAGRKIGMIGKHQIANAATAVCAIQAADIDVTDRAIERGLELAGNPGRFEVIESSDSLIWVLDGAHNPDGMKVLTETFAAWAKERSITNTLIVFGCMKDKNYKSMIKQLVNTLGGCTFSCVSVKDARALDARVIGEEIVSLGKNCICFESPDEAFSDAMLQDYECVLVVGSLYLVGEMRKLIRETGKEQASHYKRLISDNTEA